jgi:hypothetical protein
VARHKRPNQGGPKLAPVARITDKHLLKSLWNFPIEIVLNDTYRCFYLSLAVVKYFFGPEWCDEHLQDNGQSGYLTLRWRDQTDAEKQSFRIVDLAELLFNLQHVEGFDDCIQRMREGDIEGTYAELDFGRMLYTGSVDFRFVTPSGKKGDDFDIEIVLKDGIVVCADAKCKVEATEYSENSVRNSLNDARKQFPNDRPSIVFVKIPSSWFDQPNIKYELTRIANEFLRGTGRVVSVKYYVEEIYWESGAIAHTLSFQEIDNIYPINRFDPSRSWDMFAEADETATPNEIGEYSDVPKRWKRLMYFPKGYKQ